MTVERAGDVVLVLIAVVGVAIMVGMVWSPMRWIDRVCRWWLSRRGWVVVAPPVIATCGVRGFYFGSGKDGAKMLAYRGDLHMFVSDMDGEMHVINERTLG